jgi:hypothetical protein
MRKIVAKILFTNVFFIFLAEFSFTSPLFLLFYRRDLGMPKIEGTPH